MPPFTLALYVFLDKKQSRGRRGLPVIRGLTFDFLGRGIT